MTDMEEEEGPLLEIKSKKNERFLWNTYVVALRSSLARTERFFELLGRLIACNPWKTILIAITLVILCGLGLLNIKVETRTSKLFVPQNSLAEKALREGKPFFSNSLNTRTEEILFTPKSGPNILTMNALQEALHVIQRVMNITGYDEVCKPKPEFLKSFRKVYDRKGSCDVLNPLEVLNWEVVSKEQIFRSFRYAANSPSRLMSNGRSGIFNINYGLAGFEINSTAREVSAKGLRILFYLQQTDGNNVTEKILEWENAFIKTMKSARDRMRWSKLSFAADRSLDDAINESASSEVPLISVTFVVMFTFSCLMLCKFVNPVRGHTWLALLGVLSTGMGILAGMGVTMAFGIPFSNLVGVLPFLVVSIGIDDMFIIVDEFDRQSKENAPNNRVSYALSKVGATIAMTTATDCIAFYVSTTSAFPAIRFFCIYAAVCISVEFLLQITLFIAFLSLDSRRISKNRNDCCPMITVPDKTCCRLPNQFSLSSKVMNSYGNALLSAPAKVIVIVFSLAFISLGIFGCFKIDNEFSRKELALKSSYYMDYLTTFEATFPQTIPVNLQTIGKLNYSDPAVREEITKSPSIAFETGYYMSMNFTWVHQFNDFCNRFSIKADGVHFKAAIKLFLRIPSFSQHNLDIILDDNGDILASRVIVFLKDNPNAVFQKNAMLTLREDLEKRSTVISSVASDPFIYFEQYAIINREVTHNLIAVSVVILLMLVPFCIHPVVILLILFGFASLILQLIGMMYLWSIQLNAISMINIIMSIGFSVDYSAHIAHAFTTSRQKTVDQRVVEALSTVGSSVLLGGTSTFLGMSLTGFSSSNIFQTFFKMFLGIILFGLFNGLVALPVLLSLFAKAINLDTNSTIQPDFSIKSRIKRLFSRLCGETAAKKLERRSRKADSVSVVGMSTRFSTAKNKQEFWKLLTEGRNTTTEYPNNRYARFQYFEDVYNPTRPLAGRQYVSKGSYLENIERFDNKFFGISSTEAKSMDPQQRMLLQGTFEAIEDAGMKLEELQCCSTGVYVGIMNLDYSSVVLRDDHILSIDQFASTGTAFSISANRISFALNLNGPSVATDTACSSSLTALSIACDHLQKKVVDVAIVAAANIILCPKKQVTICRANMLSPDGKCKVFDERADGYGRGEGIAVFILKRSDLVNASTSDPYCDILGWGVNNDGQAAAPITAPSVEVQHGLMKNVLLQANVDPMDVQYIEMHGTGTIIGDLVETKSVGEAYGKYRNHNNPVLIGSTKSNVNHTESTAGLAGLAKVCLMLKNKQIVATVGIENESARLGINEKGLYVPVKSRKWPSQPGGRIAAVNSFGYGGSNAHLLVREPRSAMMVPKPRTLEKCAMRIFVLSARSHSGLVDNAEAFSKWLDSLPDDLESQTDVSFTLSECRTDHGFRLVVSAPDLTAASRMLQSYAADDAKKCVGICSGKITMLSCRIGFVFGGQGSQWRGMAGDILSHAAMVESVALIDKISKKLGHKESILSYLQEDDDVARTEDKEDCLVTVQLSIFALQYAVAQFIMRNACIAPMCVGGHSLGDITAACIAGIITPKEAVKIILARASLQDKCQAKGSMAAVALPEKEIMTILEELKVEEQLCIAAINDKNSITISGDTDAIDRVEEYLKKERSGIFWRKLATHKAFHSHHMESIKSEFLKQIRVAKIRPKSGKIDFISSTRGEKVCGSSIDDEYWWNNLRSAVLFENCGKQMYEDGCRTIIEISPRPVLTYYMKAIAKQADIDDILTLQALPAQKEKNRLEHLYVQCIGKMYTFGYPINISQIQPHSNGKFIRYPTYSWQESDLWAKDDHRLPLKTLHFLGVPVSVTAKLSQWENQLDLHNFEYLNDHKMKSAGIILPGACYVELALEAALWDTKVEPVVVKNIAFLNILPLHERFVRQIKANKEQSDNSLMHNFRVVFVNDQEESTLATAKLFLFHRKTNYESLTLAEAMASSLEKIKDVDDNSQTSSDDCIVADETGSSKQQSSSEESDPEGSESADDGINSLIVSAEDIPSMQLDGIDGVVSEDREFDSVDRKVCSYKAESPDDRVVLDKIGLQYEKQLSTDEFKKLAAETGFEFGDNFSLIEHAWSSEKKALTKLRLSKDVKNTLSNYIIHPCIIDACLQSCIAIGSLDPNRKVIPMGIETVRLNQITDQIKCLYGYAEATEEASDSCDVKLLDNNGNIIMYLHGFLVKEISKAHRDPVYEKSIYEMNWIPNESEGKTNSNIKELKNSKWLILSCKDNKNSSTVTKALDELEVDAEDVVMLEVEASNLDYDFQAELTAKVTEIDCEEKELNVVNLLPTTVNSFSSEADQFSNAEWLSFESNLECLKALATLESPKCKLIAVTCQVIACDAFDKSKCGAPWAATALGMARVTNLETKIPFINVDVSKDACKDDYVTAFSSLNEYSIEEGLVVSPNDVRQPLFERVDPNQAELPESSSCREKNESIYLSWSGSRGNFSMKTNVKSKFDLPEGYVEMAIDCLSSSTGVASPLLQNIKSNNSEKYLQSAVGVITNINDQRTGMKIGDKVIALFSSKWVKDSVRLPTHQVFIQPAFLSSEMSATLPACFAVANSTLNKIISITSVKSMFIVASTSNRGICWALAVLAKAKDFDVTFQDALPEMQHSSPDALTLSDIAHKHMTGNKFLMPGFDCVVCPTDLHPVDQEALINSVHNGGVLVVLDTASKSTSNHLSIQKPITLLNIRPLVTQESHQQISKSVEAVLPVLKSLDLTTYQQPNIDCRLIADICREPSDTFDESKAFSCLKMSLEQSDPGYVFPRSMDVQGLKEDRSYVVVGGNRGLGLNTVRWMASRGAGTIITIGRSDPPQETLGTFQSLTKDFGCKIITLKADVGTCDGIKALEQLLEELPQIAGIVNSAVVLDDKLFKDVDRENYQRVMAPKICGTLQLHNMLESKEQDVDFFILYSSITSVLGNTGQTTYAAANSFMNSFADYRKKVLGKNCLSICWGAMGGAGILERNAKVASLLEQTGLHLLDIPKGLEWMETVLTTMPEKSNICICDIDWMKFLQSLPTKKSKSIIYDAIRKEIPEMEGSGDGELLQMVLQARTMEKRREILIQFIVRWLAAWIGGAEEEIDRNVPLFTYGIDSVGASALKGQIEKDLQIDFEVFYFMQPETTAFKLAEDLLKAICEKFINNKTEVDEEVVEEDANEDDEPLIEEDEDKLELPPDYLAAIYNPSEAVAKFFIVHPSHRYSGVFQSLGIGFKFQKLFSLYAFGSPDPAYLGEDVGSVVRLAKACLEMLVEIQPRGPYFLGGYSFGGVVALEMATMLEKMGEKVALVVMVDTVRWLPLGRSNSHLLLDMFETRLATEQHIEEQMKNFFSKIATSQLKMKLEDYQSLASKMTFQELAGELIKKAEELSVRIPDIHKILESTTNDQIMAARCHRDWIPPKNVYRGHTIYIQAENDRFCQRITGVGNSVDSWLTILSWNTSVITVPGDHYSIMEANRSPDIGKIIAVAANIRFRNKFPTTGKLPLASSHRAALTLLQGIGMKVCLIRKIAGVKVTNIGKLRVSKRQTRLKFQPDDKPAVRCKVNIKDIMNLTELHSFSVKGPLKSSGSSECRLFAGLCISTKRNQQYTIMCFNRQDFLTLSNMMRAIYSVSLPFQLV